LTASLAAVPSGTQHDAIVPALDAVRQARRRRAECLRSGAKFSAF